MIVRAAVLAVSLMLVQPAAAAWFEWPVLGPSDAQLETIVRTAYSGAARHAAANQNYFARDGAFESLRDSVLAELARNGLGDVVVPTSPANDADAARRCLEGDGVELRIAVNMFGDGISLAAASATRVLSYHFEPREAANVVTTPAGDCV